MKPQYRMLGWALLVGVLFLSACKQSRNKSVFNYPPLAEKPKNIILLIGDGMGLTQVSAAIYNSKATHALELFPIVGFHKPYAVNNLITDSAAGATAFACGVKTYKNAIGMDRDTLPVTSILEIAEEKGLATGLVATSSIVHATPAAFIAHQPMRTDYEEIAADFLETEIDLFIGGGKKYFDRRSIDKRNLYQELQKKGYYVNNYFNADLPTLSQIQTFKNFAYFTSDSKPISSTQGREYLPPATKLACNFLEKHDEDGFFLMIEGSQIDWFGHSNESTELLNELRDFEKAIRIALNFAKRNGETLVIVTADHETGGLGINEGSKLKKLKLKFTTNGHTGTMVPVFAFGPKAELFSGIYENYTIQHKMLEALGWLKDSSDQVLPR